ncbi:MAG: S41 family peptidase [Mycoplasmatota bacterium]|nr:S41 family peptidase [Mycoplasmatota bacterium]
MRKSKKKSKKRNFFTEIKAIFLKKESKSRKKVKDKKEIEIDDDKISEIVVERNDGFNLVEVLFIVLVTVLFGIAAGYALSFTRPAGIEVSEEVQEIIATYESIVENYYGEVNEDELLEAAIAGMVGTLDDPYSTFMSGTDADTFNETVDGSFVGIGVTVLLENDKCKIIDILDDSPAEKAKLKVNDYLIKVGGETIEGLTLNEISMKIKGERGSKVDLTILRDNKEIEVSVKRDVVEVLSVSSRVIADDIGLIKIDTFAANTAEQFEKQLKELEKKKIKSLVIDVRGNPGGRLGEVSDIMDLFLDKKKVIYQIESKSKKDKIYTKDSTKRSYPVVVLVDYSSASASEILAASFQDNYKKATLVGTVTYGKGTIQKAVSLSSGATVKYTTQKWLTPKGVWINEVGLTPDVLLEIGDGYCNDPSDENDLQLQKAIEILNKKN